MAVVGTRTRTYTLQIEISLLGKRKTIKRAIGACDEWDASAARQEAQRLIAEIRTDKAKHANRRKALTLRQAWEDYARRLQARVDAGERSSRTLHSYKDHMERLLGDWLERPLREIGEAPELVAKKHAELTENAGRYIANRAMVTLRAVYNHALKKRLDPSIPPHNPVESVDFNIEQRRNTGMPSDELQLWIEQLQKLQNPIRREFHLFTLLSAMRPDALKRARWGHLDVKKRILHIPSPKGGKRRAFDLPLSRPMLRSLWRARKAGRILHWENSQQWIFPANTPTGHLSEHKEKRTILSHWGGDLRQTYRGMAVLAGVDELSIRILMNHALGDVSTGYLTVAALRNHLRAQQERISQFIIGAINSH